MALLVLITNIAHFEISTNISIFFVISPSKNQSFFFFFFFWLFCFGLKKCLRRWENWKRTKRASSVEEEGKCDESWWQYLEVWANVLIINKFFARSDRSILIEYFCVQRWYFNWNISSIFVCMCVCVCVGLEAQIQTICAISKKKNKSTVICAWAEWRTITNALKHKSVK